jgi:hypothetical protein
MERNAQKCHLDICTKICYAAHHAKPQRSLFENLEKQPPAVSLPKPSAVSFQPDGMTALWVRAKVARAMLCSLLTQFEATCAKVRGGVLRT